MTRRVVTALLLGSLVALSLMTPALAGDQPTVIYPEDEERQVAPGDTVDVDVMVNSDGGYDHAGVAHIGLEAEYEAEYLNATSAEPGPYLEQGEPTDVHDETEIDNDEGVVAVEQWRDPARGGSTGNERFATITFDVAEDAPESNTTISFEGSEVELIDEYAIFVYDHDATLVIDETLDTDGSDSSTADIDATGTTFFVVLVGLFVVFGGLTVWLRKRYGADE